MGKIIFKGYTDEQKKAIQNSLMNSPICWKDGNFKFDRDTLKEPCKGKSCFTCMFETFDLAIR